MDDDFDDDVQRPQYEFPDALKALQSYNAQNKSIVAISYGLSGLTDEQITELRPIWNMLEPGYRREIMQILSDIGETDFVMDYSRVGLMGLDDADPGVRKSAIGILWVDNSLELMGRFIKLTLNDETIAVRAAASSALGRFIYAGELEDLPEGSTIPAQEAVIKIWNNPNEDVSVRRRALESISKCSHEIVAGAISEAYHSDEQPMRVSAIYAMGSTYDRDRWAEIVLEELESDDPEICYEAARSAGSLEIHEAVTQLGKMILSDDRELVEIAVWSLGEIGNREALRLLEILAEKAEEDGDDDLAESIDDAIGNATLMSGFLAEFEDIDDYDD